MITFTGELVLPDNEVAPSLRAIGIGMGRMPRFAGQTDDWYSVLCHSMVVAALVDPELAIHGLFHDAAEAILGDMPSSWKTEERRDLEHQLTARIYTAYDIPEPNGAYDIIKQADHDAYVAEGYVLGHQGTMEANPEPLPMAAELTEYHLSIAPDLIHAETAATVFEYAVEHYRLKPNVLVKDDETIGSG